MRIIGNPEEIRLSIQQRAGNMQPVVTLEQLPADSQIAAPLCVPKREGISVDLSLDPNYRRWGDQVET